MDNACFAWSMVVALYPAKSLCGIEKIVVSALHDSVIFREYRISDNVQRYSEISKSQHYIDQRIQHRR